MEVANKRCRKENFTSDEVEALSQGVAKRKHVINAKFGSMVTKETKLEAWEAIAAEVSSVSGILRTAADIQKKWTQHKSAVKQKVRFDFVFSIKQTSCSTC